MYKTFILLLCFVAGMAPATFAQRKTRNKHNPGLKSLPKNNKAEAWTLEQRVSFKLTPTSLLDSYGALLPLGLEYYFDEKFGVSFDVALPLYYVLNNYRDAPHKKINSDYRLRADIRQYFALRQNNRFYVGTEAFFRHQTMTLEDSYLHFINGHYYEYSFINARKSVFGFGVLTGCAKRLSERLILEGHLGIGVRVINMRTDLDIDALVPVKGKTFTVLDPPGGDRVGDRDINIYIPLAIKIAYLF